MAEMPLPAYGGTQYDCPRCGTPVTMPTREQRHIDDGATQAIAVVVTDPGTAHAHIRDAHPELWAQLCEQQRQLNASPYMPGMPRRVDGAFLRPGEDVGNLRSDIQ